MPGTTDTPGAAPGQDDRSYGGPGAAPTDRMPRATDRSSHSHVGGRLWRNLSSAIEPSADVCPDRGLVVVDDFAAPALLISASAGRRYGDDQRQDKEQDAENTRVTSK